MLRRFWCIALALVLHLGLGAVEVVVTPASVNAPLGGISTLTATVRGGGSTAFQWRRNGRPIPGETRPSLIIFNQPQAMADYDVVADTDAGVALSRPVPVVVKVRYDDGLLLRVPLDQATVRETTGHGVAHLSEGSGPAPRPVPAAGRPFAGGWDFQGAGRHVVVDSNPFLQSFGDPRQGHGMTVAFWVRMPATRSKANEAVLAGLNQVLSIVENGEGGLNCQFGLHYYFPYAQFRSRPLDDGQWHHVLLTCDFRSGQATFFIDGQIHKVGTSGKDDFTRVNLTKMATPGPNLVDPLRIGTDGQGKRPWKGGIAGVLLLARPLAKEDAAAFAAGTVGPTGLPRTPSPIARVVPPRVVLLPEGAETVTLALTGFALGPEAVTSRWTHGWGVRKGTMTIEDADKATARVTLTGTGVFPINFTVTDAAKQKDVEIVQVTVARNAPPSIGAIEVEGGPLRAGVGGTVTVAAAVNDDELPAPPALLRLAWTQVSGPGTVAIATPWKAKTAVTLPPAAGDYVLRLTADDGAAQVTSEMTVSVGGAGSLALTATAQDRTLDLNQTNRTTLAGSLPTAPAGATYRWRQVRGPMPAVLASPTALTTAVTIDRIGAYEFELAVTVEGITATATAWLNAWMPGALPIDPGSSRLAWLPEATIPLKATAKVGPGATMRWSVIGGPGEVRFAKAEALETTATFTTAGTYELEILAIDGPRQGNGRLIVEVYPADQTFGGYTPAELKGYTTDLGHQLDFTGLAWSRIRPAPAPNVHPRILFDPDDLPDLRRRLTATPVGPEVMKKIRDMAGYLTKDQELIPVYAALTAGDISLFKSARAPTDRIVGCLVNEAFRVLIDEDAAAGAKAGKALATIADYLTDVVIPPARAKAEGKPAAWMGVEGPIFGDRLAWAYDFLHPSMTPAQRTAVRRMLVRATDHLTVLGFNTLPGMGPNTSNWIPLTSQRYLFTVLAIEGEEGADPEPIRKYIASVNRQAKCLGWPDGSLDEGGGKGWLGSQQYLALAKRGCPMVASATFRNFIREFVLHCVNPTGFGFTMDEMNGSTNQKPWMDDMATAKYLYPEDPVIDFVYRNAWSTKGEDPAQFRSAFVGGLLHVAILAEDYQRKLTWDEALATQVRPTAPLTKWFPYRGLLVARSAWAPDATRLYFQPRCLPGGHANADRNTFVLHGLGRCWVPMNVYQSGSGWVPGDSTMPTSIVRVDDLGSGTAPSTEIDVVDSPRLACATGDARDAYRAINARKDDPEEPIGWTFNSTHRLQLEEGWARTPYANLPHWFTSQKQQRTWKVRYPDARAFRTAALVRPIPGTRTQPYVLIADDLQMDAAPHTYAWRMMLENDLRGREKVSGSEVVYTAPDGKTGLLVRLLASKGTPRFVTDNRYKYFDWPWLDIQVEGVVRPDFRVLLMPFTVGTPLPKTSWQEDILTVDHGGGQVDRVQFRREAAGWTRVRLVEAVGR